jgi:hypothetical protein
MGLFSRRNRTRKDASRAIRSITGGLEKMLLELYVVLQED